jgi:hypothetical protein
MEPLRHAMQYAKEVIKTHRETPPTQEKRRRKNYSSTRKVDYGREDGK